jgi:hypothetical protein
MLSSVFEVLADSRMRTQAQLDASEALRDYWLAFADVQAVLAGVAPEGNATGPASARPGPDKKAAH